jgi:hypothetical protein
MGGNKLASLDLVTNVTPDVTSRGIQTYEHPIRSTVAKHNLMYLQRYFRREYMNRGLQTVLSYHEEARTLPPTCATTALFRLFCKLPAFLPSS